MQVVSRPYVLAAAALVATGAVIATPMLSRQVPLAVRSMETKLVDVGIENIPTNLFDDILNIPYNETVGGGLGSVANSFLFTGTWWVPSSTNIWGIDPGDPTHIALIDNFLGVPAFTEGFTNAQGVYEPGLNYEFAGVLAAELPNSASCAALSCGPMTPPDVITGSTQFDRDIGFFDSLMGKGIDSNGDPNGLFTQFFQVPLQNLINGYTYQAPPVDTPTTGEPTYDPGAINPAGAVNDEWAKFLGWGSSGDPFEGGTRVVDLPGYGPSDVNPWYGLDFHLNLLQPFQTLIDSLEQDPSTTGIAGTGVDALSFTDVAHTFENLEAGLIIDFDPFTEGSPACPALCDLPAGMQIPALVQDIANSDPSNTVLQAFLTNYAADPASVNEPTQPEINASVALLQTGIYNLDSQELADVDKALNAINPELPQLFTHSGYYTDPTYLAYTDGATTVTDPSTGDVVSVIDPTTGQLDAIYGGYNPLATLNDFYTLFTNNDTNFNELGNPALLLFLADPLTSPDPFNGGAVDGGTPFYETLFGTGTSAAAESTGASAAAGDFSTDLTTLLASFGGTAGADALSAAMAEISAQITADLAQVVPQSLLSMF